MPRLLFSLVIPGIPFLAARIGRTPLTAYSTLVQRSSPTAIRCCYAALKIGAVSRIFVPHALRMESMAGALMMSQH